MKYKNIDEFKKNHDFTITRRTIVLDAEYRRANLVELKVAELSYISS